MTRPGGVGYVLLLCVLMLGWHCSAVDSSEVYRGGHEGGSEGSSEWSSEGGRYMRYEDYLHVFEKDLTRASDRVRREQYETTVRFIERHNNDTGATAKGRVDVNKPSFTLRLNQFSDLTSDEIALMFSTPDRGHDSSHSVHNVMSSESPSSTRRLLSDMHTSLPPYINWADRTKNPKGRSVVSSVGNQGVCGACWAYTAVYATEASARIAGHDVSLSVQELLNCDRNGTVGMNIPPAMTNNGCSGGNPIRAFSYIKKYGLEEKHLLDDYKEKVQQCMIKAESFAVLEKELAARRQETMASSPLLKQVNHDYGVVEKTRVVSISSFVVLPSGEESLMKEYVGRIGPLTIGICGTDPRFVYYGDGILDISDCCTTLNHAVLVVGYGTENGNDYWIAQNSWGAQWGDKGFIKLKRFETQRPLGNVFHKGVCGMAQSVSVPLGGFVLLADTAPAVDSPDQPKSFMSLFVEWFNTNSPGITLVMSAIMILLAVCMFFAALRLDHMQWKQRMLASEQQRIDCEEEEIDTVDEILNERYGFSPPSPSRCKYGSVS